MALLATYGCRKCPGIKEDVDLNVFNGSLEELKKLTIK